MCNDSLVNFSKNLGLVVASIVQFLMNFHKNLRPVVMNIVEFLMEDVEVNHDVVQFVSDERNEVFMEAHH